MPKLYLFALLMLLCAFDEPKLSRKNVMKGVSVLVPADFVPMPDSEIALRVPSHRKPKAVYSDRYYEIILTVNTATTEWAYKDLNLLKDFYKSNIQNMFVNLEFKQQGIKQVGKYQFVCFEFVGVVNSESKMIKRGKAVYNYIFYTVSQGEILVFNFYCPYHLKDKWKDTAKKIMESIQIDALPDVAR